jgi:hypothetical protein
MDYFSIIVRTTVFTGAFLVALVTIPAAIAQNNGGFNSDIIPFASELDTPVTGYSDVENIIVNIIKWLYTIFFLVAVFFILLAAYNFIAGARDENRLKKAKDQLKYAVIAIVIALVASGVSIIIKSFLSSAA